MSGMALRKSASLPGLLRSSSGSSGTGVGSPSPKLCKGTLLVGQPANSDGKAEWEPFYMQHQRDGSLTMLAADDSRPAKSQTYMPPRAGHDGVHHLLDVDWRKPFIVKPGKPLAYSQGPTAAKTQPGQQPSPQKPGGADQTQLPQYGLGASSSTSTGAAAVPADATCMSGGKEVYPFTLTYAPSQALLGEPDGAAPLRRTVLLAAQNLAARDRWLTTLTRKAWSPAIRKCSDSAGVGSGHLASLGPMASPGHMQNWTSLRPPGTGRGESPLAPPRLMPARNTGIWDASSKLHVVRELYDSYAADPLGEFDLRRGRHVSASPEARPSRELLERYVDKQQVIEELLQQRHSTSRMDLNIPVPTVEDDDVGFSFMTEPEDTSNRRNLPLLNKSSNVALDGWVMQNDEWGGGVLLNPKNPKRWSLTILPEDVDVIPIFIGIAPTDMELSMVNFFDPRQGVFLCMGGLNATAALTASMGTKGGPLFHALGERSPAHLPVPARGKKITVSYSEEVPEGKAAPVANVVFSVEGEEEGEGSFFGRPRLKKQLPLGIWRPCIYLCLPKTRLTVTEFS